MSVPTSRVEVVYRGRVQGVGFRATVRELARSLPVTGWVRNEPDGTVSAQIQGTRDEIERVLRLVDDRMGGFIRGKATQDIPPQQGEVDFEIRR